MRRLATFCLAASSILLTLLALEVASRFVAYRHDRRLLEEAIAARHAPTGEVHLKDLIRPSTNREIIYELIPGVSSTTFLGAKLSINELGFRGRAYPIEKDAGTIRIVGLGDSVMFGWGVPDGRDYLSTLEERLNAAHPEARWQIINTAVPGYNTVMEVAAFEAKALRFAPDLVIVGYCDNDLELPRFVRKFSPPDDSYFRLDRSFLWQLVLERLERSGTDDDVPRFLRRARKMQRTSRRDRAAIPQEYIHMTGLDACRRALERLAKLGREHGFEVIVLFHPAADDRIEAIATSCGFAVADTLSAVERFLARHGQDELVGSPLTRSAEDYHPSILGHQMIAAVLLATMDERGLSDPAHYGR